MEVAQVGTLFSSADNTEASSVFLPCTRHTHLFITCYVFLMVGKAGPQQCHLRGFEYDGEGREFNVGNYEAVRGWGGSIRVLQMQYFSFLFHPRATGQHLFLAGRLLQEYIVDAWACIEQNRLRYLSSHQSDLRCELYSGVMDAINELITMLHKLVVR